MEQASRFLCATRLSGRVLRDEKVLSVQVVGALARHLKPQSQTLAIGGSGHVIQHRDARLIFSRSAWERARSVVAACKLRSDALDFFTVGCGSRRPLLLRCGHTRLHGRGHEHGAQHKRANDGVQQDLLPRGWLHEACGLW